MADINSLISKAVTGAAVVSSVGGLIQTFKKAIPKVPDPDEAVKNLSQSAQATLGSQSVVGTTRSIPIAEVVAQSRASVQTVSTLAYPEDPSPYEVVLNFIEFKQGNNRESGRQLITRSLREVQDSTEIVQLFNTSIILPLPANLAETLGIQYEQLDQGNFLGDITAGITDSISRLGGANDFANTVAQIEGIGAGAVSYVKNNVSPAAFEAAIRASIGGTIGGVVGQTRGNIVNPQRTLQFNGVDLRVYEYNWRFSPNTENESRIIREIVKKLQTKALPAKTEKYFLKYPDLVQVRFKRLEKQLYEHKLCFIEAVTVNYAPNGQPAFFAETDAPAEIEIGIRLRETSIRTREDYLEFDDRSNL